MEAIERQTQVLDAIRSVMLPLVRLLIDEGIGYQSFIAQIKSSFIEQALAQVQERGEKDTDSALSLRTGIHRKDINAWRQNPMPSPKMTKRSIPNEVYARWISDPLYQHEDGTALPLPRMGSDKNTLSFETLARSVNQDVHPLSVLNELIRLGLAQLEPDAQGQECVVLHQTGFVPHSDWTQMLELWVANLAAHIETATQNLNAAPETKQLEQAAYAGGLTEASAHALAQLSRTLWADMLKEFLQEASRLYAQDEGKGMRLVRLGAYFHDGHLDSSGSSE